MSALSVFIIFFLCLIIAIPISIGLGIVQYFREFLILLLPQAVSLSSDLCLGESTVFRCWRCRCLYYQAW